MTDSPVDDPLALERQVCFALALASRSVIAAYKPVLQPMGLTHPQYLVMLALWQHEPLTLKALQQLLQLDAGTLSPLVKRLDTMGLITRSRDPRDERSLAIALTAEGRALRAQAESIPPTMMRKLGLSPEELQILHRTMMALIDATRDETAA
ncbi:MarR family winged helix-turn-helix transcriptional regulator [Humidisolicoccus flavus]|uniref:MarR family winged helix-turn-helix transcriptional regulator n=1 Tax=Humidisolicoccus flavus TaxID=3111414 RepID=UPI0032510B8D